ITQDTGSSGSDFVTSDNTLVFNLSTTGTLASGEYVQISLNGGATWIKAVQGSGNSWSYDRTLYQTHIVTHQTNARNARCRGVNRQIETRAALCSCRIARSGR
ncbi:Ig-like domain-containing protein, partial [Acinetobacter soli]